MLLQEVNIWPEATEVAVMLTFEDLKRLCHAYKQSQLHIVPKSICQPHVRLQSKSWFAVQGVDSMVAKLTNSLRGAQISPRQAADAIKHLLHLHAEGARSCQHLDPVKLYLEAQVVILLAQMHA